MIELRNIGLISKYEDLYIVEKEIEISKDGFIDFITNKFLNYTPFIALKKLKQSKIQKEDVINILKQIFKQEFQDNTWEAYANNLISWFTLSKLPIKEKIVEPKKGRGGINSLDFSNADKDTFLPRSSIKEILEVLPLFELDESLVNSKYNKDLLFLEIIDRKKQLTDFGRDLIQLKDSELIKNELKIKCLEYKKIKILKQSFEANPKIKAKDLVTLLSEDFFDGKEASSKLIYSTKALSWIK